MKHLIAALLLVALALQPTIISARQTPEKKTERAEKRTTDTPAAPSRAEAQSVRTIPIEELLPSNTLSFITTTSLSGLVEGFRRLEAYKALEARLPKAERESADNPLDQAARLLSFGIKEAGVLDETRLGFASFKADTPPETDQAEVAKKTASRKARLTRVDENSDVTDFTPGAPDVPPPQFVAFVEASTLEQAKKARAQFIAFYSEMIADLGRPDEAKPVKEPRFKGAAVERLKNGYFGTMIGTTYVLGEPGAIETILKLRASGDVARLADDLDYIQARSKLSAPAALFAYVHGKTLDGYLEPLAKMAAGFMGPRLDFVIAPGAIKSVAFSSSFERDGVVDRMVVSLDSAKKNLLSTIWSGPAVEFRSAGYIPAGTQILVSHSLDFTKLYDDLIVPAVFGTMATNEAYRVARKEIEASKAQKNDSDKKDKDDDEADREADASAMKKAREESQKPEYINALIARYEKEIGMKFREEIARDLGNEITLAIEIPRAPTALETESREHIAAMFAIRDREATRVALNKLIAYAFGALGNGMAGNRNRRPGEQDGDDAQPPAQAEEKPKTDEQLRKEQEQREAMAKMLPRESYKKAEIISVVAFAIGILDDYVILADSSETIKRMIDAAENSTSMAREPNFTLALSGATAASGTRVYAAPKFFDESLTDFVKAWSVKAPGTSAAPPLNLPATLAGFVEADDRSIRLEAWTPVGVPGLFAFSAFSSKTESRASEHESEAWKTLKTLARVEKRYAADHGQRYATLDELIKYQKDHPRPATPDDRMTKEQIREMVIYSMELGALKAEKNNYRYALKLKPAGKGFEVTATPVKYGRDGRHSFFIDETGKLRRADKNGEPANASDEPANDRNDDDKEDDK